jgi:hypothetical protein
MMKIPMKNSKEVSQPKYQQFREVGKLKKKRCQTFQDKNSKVMRE